MQHITEVLKVLKTRHADAYVLVSSGDICIETAGKKRGSRNSATIVCEADARAMAREITGGISEEERDALAGLVLFFDFQRQLGEALEEQEILAEIEAEVAAEEAGHSVATGREDELASLKSLAQFPYQFFVGLGITTISGLMETLSGDVDYDILAADHVKAGCQALFVYTNNAVWMERAEVARTASWRNLDPGQFHGADGAEAAHIEAKATVRKLTPVAQFVVEGVKYVRKLDKGTADEVTALKADILIRWGNAVERTAFPTLKVSWVAA